MEHYGSAHEDASSFGAFYQLRVRRLLRRIVGLDAVALRLRPQVRQMLMVTGFDGAEDVNGRDIAAGEGAIVHDLLDARASWTRFVRRDRPVRPVDR